MCFFLFFSGGSIFFVAWFLCDLPVWGEDRGWFSRNTKSSLGVLSLKQDTPDHSPAAYLAADQIAWSPPSHPSLGFHVRFVFVHFPLLVLEGIWHWHLLIIFPEGVFADGSWLIPFDSLSHVNLQGTGPQRVHLETHPLEQGPVVDFTPS